MIGNIIKKVINWNEEYKEQYYINLAALPKTVENTFKEITYTSNILHNHARLVHCKLKTSMRRTYFSISFAAGAFAEVYWINQYSKTDQNNDIKEILKNIRGIAHLCEHLIYGQNHFEKNYRIRSWFTQHNGYLNASTNNTEMKFWFEIPSTYEIEAITIILTAIYKKKHIRSASILNEVNAIGEENDNLLDNKEILIVNILKQLSAYYDSENTFTTAEICGNMETLQLNNKNNLNFVKKIVQKYSNEIFHKCKATICIISDKSNKHYLKVFDRFSAWQLNLIENYNYVQHNIIHPAFIDESLSKLIFLKCHQKKYEFRFLICEKYRRPDVNFALDFLVHILSRRGRKSLHMLLATEFKLKSISACVSHHGFGQIFLDIEFYLNLTENLYDHNYLKTATVISIINCIFMYIDAYALKLVGSASIDISFAEYIRTKQIQYKCSLYTAHINYANHITSQITNTFSLSHYHNTLNEEELIKWAFFNTNYFCSSHSVGHILLLLREQFINFEKIIVIIPINNYLNEIYLDKELRNIIDVNIKICSKKNYCIANMQNEFILTNFIDKMADKKLEYKTSAEYNNFIQAFESIKSYFDAPTLLKSIDYSTKELNGLGQKLFWKYKSRSTIANNSKLVSRNYSSEAIEEIINTEYKAVENACIVKQFSLYSKGILELLEENKLEEYLPTNNDLRLRSFSYDMEATSNSIERIDNLLLKKINSINSEDKFKCYVIRSFDLKTALLNISLRICFYNIEFKNSKFFYRLLRNLEEVKKPYTQFVFIKTLVNYWKNYIYYNYYDIAIKSLAKIELDFIPISNKLEYGFELKLIGVSGEKTIKLFIDVVESMYNIIYKEFLDIIRKIEQKQSKKLMNSDEEYDYILENNVVALLVPTELQSKIEYMIVSDLIKEIEQKMYNNEPVVDDDNKLMMNKALKNPIITLQLNGNISTKEARMCYNSIKTVLNENCLSNNDICLISNKNNANEQEDLVDLKIKLLNEVSINSNHPDIREMYNTDINSIYTPIDISIFQLNMELQTFSNFCDNNISRIITIDSVHSFNCAEILQKYSVKAYTFLYQARLNTSCYQIRLDINCFNVNKYIVMMLSKILHNEFMLYMRVFENLGYFMSVYVQSLSIGKHLLVIQIMSKKVKAFDDTITAIIKFLNFNRRKTKFNNGSKSAKLEVSKIWYSEKHFQILKELILSEISADNIDLTISSDYISNYINNVKLGNTYIDSIEEFKLITYDKFLEIAFNIMYDNNRILQFILSPEYLLNCKVFDDSVIKSCLSYEKDRIWVEIRSLDFFKNLLLPNNFE